MLSKSSLAALYTSSALWLSAGCIDVTCAERGTCPPEGNTDEDAATGETQSDGAVSVPTRTDGEAGSPSGTDDSSRASTSPSTGSNSATHSGDAAITATSMGPDAASSTLTSDATSLGTTQTPSSQPTSEPDQCEAGSCGCGADCSTAPEAGPRTECSPDEVAACSEAKPICVFDQGAALCLGCVTDEHCVDPTPICVATACQLCDLDTHRGCDAPTPFCVSSANPSAPVDGGTTSGSVGTSNAPATNDASATGAAASQASAIVDAGEASTGTAVEATRACVECRTGADCTEGEPFCIDGACEQCQVDTDCTDPNAPRCDAITHQCSGCTELGACSRFAATPACDLGSGSCVECTAAEASACEDYACQTIPGDGQFTCSAQPLGVAGTCETCVSDAACEQGMACLLDTYENQPTEWTCLPSKPNGGCVTPPLLGSLSGSSADQQVGDFCRPASHVSCAAFRDFGSDGADTNPDNGAWCDSDDDCGLPDVADGLCLPYHGNSETKLCSYACGTSVECANNTTCTSGKCVW